MVYLYSTIKMTHGPINLRSLFHHVLLNTCFSLHKDTTTPQLNHTVTPTHIEPEQYNTWNKSTISRKLLKMDVLTFETFWAANSEIKQVTSSWSIFIQPLKLAICCSSIIELPLWNMCLMDLPRRIWRILDGLNSSTIVAAPYSVCCSPRSG